MKSCSDYSRLLGPFFDGELDATATIEVDEHVATCETCGERVTLLGTMKASLKKTSETKAPDDFRARVAASMKAEGTRREEKKTRAPSLIWGTLVPLAAAATFALVWRAAPHKGDYDARAAAGIGDDLLSDLVSEHSAPLPPEHTDPKMVRGLEKYVGVPVHPARFERVGAKFVGGRVLPVHHQRAAMLQYVVGSGDDARRVSLLVYDPQKIRVSEDDLSTRSVGAAHVRVGKTKGYSVAMVEQSGVGYALASDLDPERSAEFAAMLYDDVP